MPVPPPSTDPSSTASFPMLPSTPPLGDRQRWHLRLRRRFASDAGAVAIEYVIVAIALLAIAGAIAAALTSLGEDAVESIPDSISEANG